MQTTFNKRIYDPAGFYSALQDLFSHIDELRRAARRRRVSRAFAEKIMLAVTQVNGCRYCSYGHSRLALAAGVSEDELRDLLAGDLGNFPEAEAVALSYAQHYAETQGQPDPEARQRLLDTYGPETAADIACYIRMISFGNLLGNTFDAFLSRLKGAPASDSRFLGELCVLLSTLTVIPIRMFFYLLVRPFSRTRLEGSA